MSLEELEDGSTDLPSRDRLLYCWGFCRALSGHHDGEDRVLFPHLVAADPRLGPVVVRLRQDHSMVEHLLAGLEDALRSGAPVEQVRAHLDGIGAIMENHVRYEERELLDVLDALDGHDLGPAEAFGPLAR